MKAPDDDKLELQQRHLQRVRVAKSVDTHSSRDARLVLRLGPYLDPQVRLDVSVQAERAVLHQARALARRKWGSLPEPRDPFRPETVWNAVQPCATDGSAVSPSPIRLVRLSYLRKMRRWRRRQVLERDAPEAFIRVEELRALPRLPNDGLAVYIVSHLWQRKSQPDPYDLQMHSLMGLIRRAHDVPEAGVFIDYLSLYQPEYHDKSGEMLTPLTAQEREAFDHGLDLVNILFVHALCPVLILNGIIDPSDESCKSARLDARAITDASTAHASTTSPPLEQAEVVVSHDSFISRGWPWFELRVAMLLKSSSTRMVVCADPKQMDPWRHCVDLATFTEEMKTRQFAKDIGTHQPSIKQQGRFHGFNSMQRVISLFSAVISIVTKAVSDLGFGDDLHAWRRHWKHQYMVTLRKHVAAGPGGLLSNAPPRAAARSERVALPRILSKLPK